MIHSITSAYRDSDLAMARAAVRSVRLAGNRPVQANRHVESSRGCHLVEAVKHSRHIQSIKSSDFSVVTVHVFGSVIAISPEVSCEPIPPPILRGHLAECGQCRKCHNLSISLYRELWITPVYGFRSI